MTHIPNKPTWYIHYVFDYDYLPQYMCNIHTHGLERYGHLNLQIVIALPREQASYILNSIGDRIRCGECFHEGDEVKGYFINDMAIHVKKFFETDREVLRLILPDEKGHYPDDKDCAEPFRYQLFEIENNLLNT